MENQIPVIPSVQSPEQKNQTGRTMQAEGRGGKSRSKGDRCPAQALSQIGGQQEGQSKDSNDLRPKVMAVVCRLLDSVPFVQVPSVLRLFPGMLPLVERAPHPSQLLLPPCLPQSLCCGCLPQRARRHHLPGSNALFVNYSSRQEK